MKRRFPLTLDPQLFSEEGAAPTGVEVASAAEMHETSEVPAIESGESNTAAAEPEKQNNFEKAFAKRLAAEKAKWEADTSERYKDYDVLKKATEYLQKTSGISDVMTLKEQLELAELQERAEAQNIPPKLVKRLDELESKATRYDEMEQKQQQQQVEQSFWTAMDAFVDGKGIERDALNQFMIENKLFVDPNDPADMERGFTLAMKAMRADLLEQEKVALQSEKEQAEKEGMKKLIAAKAGIPSVLNGTNQATISTGAPKTFAEARARAMQRGI